MMKLIEIREDGKHPTVINAEYVVKLEEGKKTDGTPFTHVYISTGSNYDMITVEKSISDTKALLEGKKEK